MRVLIGVDESPYSEAALEFVQRMSWPAETRMIVVSSLAPEASSFGAYEPAAAVKAAGLVERIREFQEKLVERSQKTLTDAGLQAEGRVIEGDPREALLDLARREGVGLIVVGSHGRTGLEKLLMGSVASHIVTHAACSVLVVRRGTSPGGRAKAG
jgi:nucleotide-binding universal stress UspA family protein